MVNSRPDRAHRAEADHAGPDRCSLWAFAEAFGGLGPPFNAETLCYLRRY